MTPITRRGFLASSLSAAAVAHHFARAEDAEPIIDIHQHTNYKGRTDAQFLAHQRALGVTRTVILPAGSPVSRPSTDAGRSNGLGGAGAGGNETAVEMARRHPREFMFAANEVPDLPEARGVIEGCLKAGAVMIGEQKFHVECDSPEMQVLYSLAAEYRVPILLHFKHGAFNLGFDRFYKMLEKYPKTVFIGHAQAWWANIDRNHADQNDHYPKGKVTPGGLTDRFLSDYPNAFADMSAGSGLNALTRDEEHSREFLGRHQDKILYGSDCIDHSGVAAECQGAQTIAALRRLSPSKDVERKILFENARKLLGL